jgi:hypothetical protein
MGTKIDLLIEKFNDLVQKSQRGAQPQPNL